MLELKTVFIDIDDTLWWFTENSKISFRHVFDEFNMGGLCSYEQFHDHYIVKNQELWRKYHHGEIDKDFLNHERFRYTLQQCGYGGDCLELGDRMNEAYLDYLAGLPTTVPGAKELLEYLNGKGYDVNTLSNGFAGLQQRKLRSGGLDHLVHRNVLSDDCGITKPLPGIFEYAMQVCGAMPETTVMIGDDPDADMAGAHAVGWKTIYFNLKHLPIEKGLADHVVENLLDIKQIL